LAQPQERIDGFDDPGELVSTGTPEEAMEVMRRLGNEVELTAEDLFIDPELLKG